MFVRTQVRWKILFPPYLVVELSPRAEIWCVSVTSINDGTQILTFLGIDNNRDFQNCRFLYGNWIIKILSCIDFYFQIDSNRCIAFPDCALIVKSNEYLSKILAEISVLGMPLLWMRKVCATALRSFKKHDHGAHCGIKYYIMYCKFSPKLKYEFLIFGIFVVQGQKCLYIL